MSPEQIAAFFLFALVAAITPGPSNVLLVATGAQVGILRGFACLLGIGTGMASMMFLAAYGLGNLLLAHPQILIAARLAGTAFLLWLAWKIASVPPAPPEAGAKPTGFIGAALLQWVNPKAWMVSAGAVATYLPADDGNALLFTAVFVAAAFPSGFVWLAFGAAAQRLLGDPRRQRIFNIAMGLALAASVAMMWR